METFILGLMAPDGSTGHSLTFTAPTWREAADKARAAERLWRVVDSGNDIAGMLLDPVDRAAFRELLEYAGAVFAGYISAADFGSLRTWQHPRNAVNTIMGMHRDAGSVPTLDHARMIYLLALCEAVRDCEAFK